MSSDKPVDNIDPLLLNKVFPDPQGLLDHVCEPINKVKSSTIVCLDANVMLLPYEFSGTSLGSVIAVYEQLSARNALKIPAQAAREYLKHRSEKISEIDKVLSEHSSKKGPSLGQINFMEGSKDLGEIRGFENDIKAIEKKIATRVDKLRRQLNGETGTDPISNAYRDVFRDAVVEIRNFDQTEFLNDLKYRYANKIPPGFKDAGKPDGGAGDLLIWRTILQIGEEMQKPVIFVTADAKGDWWTKRGDSERARLELVDEYRIRSGGHSFYLLKLSELLRLYGASVDEVENVKNVEDEFARSIDWIGLDFEESNRNAFSRIEALRRRRDHLKSQMVVMQRQDRKYIPPRHLRELRNVENELAGLQRAMHSQNLDRHADLHSIHQPLSRWHLRPDEPMIEECCPECGGQRLARNHEGTVVCLECLSI